jgi:hypothetical protein
MSEAQPLTDRHDRQSESKDVFLVAAAENRRTRQTENTANTLIVYQDQAIFSPRT